MKKTSEREINVGVLGCGTVGSGVVRLLMENAAVITARSGIKLNLYRAVDIDPQKEHRLGMAPGVFSTDAMAVVNDPAVDIVVEMIGGLDLARQLIEAALTNGKHVVTANKALLAVRGNELAALAHRKAVDLAFEASVGGCMPIVKTLREALVANRITCISGILNGTCNYILTCIQETGVSFEAALAQARENGFAEADPHLDISGGDTSHKLAILSTLAYGMPLNLDDVYVEGIERLTPIDIAYAKEFGYRIKLLAISKLKKDRIEARVHPTMLPCRNVMARVDGVMNAVAVNADAVGEMLLFGHGAGMLPTASAVICDIVDIARNLIFGAGNRMPCLGFQPGQMCDLPIVAIDEINTHYYIRFTVADSPGVLARIAGVLGQHGISIKSVQQRGRQEKGPVAVVMLTHLAAERKMRAALETIEQLEQVCETPMLIRIEDPLFDE